MYLHKLTYAEGTRDGQLAKANVTASNNDKSAKDKEFPTRNVLLATNSFTLAMLTEVSSTPFVVNRSLFEFTANTKCWLKDNQEDNSK